MSLRNIFVIAINEFFSTSVHLNLTLVEHNLVKGDSVCAQMRHM